MQSRTLRHALVQALSVMTWSLCATSAWAAPPTSGTGPGGFEVMDGSSALRVWLRADALTGSVTPGATFGTWNDSSFYNYNVTDATPAAIFNANVFNAANPQPGVSFNNQNIGAGVFTAANFSTIFTNGNNATMFTAYQNSPFPSNQHLGITTTGTAPNQVDVYQLNSFNGDFRGSRIENLSLGYPQTGQTIKTVVSSAAGAGSWTLFADGQQLHTTPTQSWSPSANFNVGASNHGSSSFTGDIGEIIIFNTALNMAQRQIIENYLSSKFDMALTTGDLYAGDTVGNGHYDLNVFGVGQAADGSQVTAAGAAGFGIEVTGGLDNGEFILAGHNVENNSWTTADLPDSVEARSDRVFYLDVTDNPDGFSADLVFDLSDLGLVPGDDSTEYVLLYSADGVNPTFTTLGSADLSNVDQLTFSLSAAQLQDGIFTIGFANVPEPSTIALWSCIGALAMLAGVRSRRRAARQRAA